MDLNERAALRLERLASKAGELRIGRSVGPGGATLWDFGVALPGGLEAGRELALLCLADLGDVRFAPARDGRCSSVEVQVSLDQPVFACLASQYAGWQIKAGKYFAMGSGPMRQAAAREPLFEHLPGLDQLTKRPTQAVGILEASTFPTAEAVAQIAEKTQLPAERISLCVAPVTSLAGVVQVVARSVETALHKLHELEFPLAEVVSAFGSAPLPPPSPDALVSMGRTNDAILYGGEVTLWVRSSDELLQEVGAKTPSCSSPDFGRPFADLFKAAGYDFYKIDPLLFSPAVVRFVNLSTGRTFRFGRLAPEILEQSFS